ncbi:MAG: CoA ester lyase [Pseudonocardiaceae bacterium]|nr:MAG: CoA ester lyase [Pseudonocardiaceae bacterium]
MRPRSYLYVPGDRDERFARAAERGADALVFDLEDAVAPPAKDAARAAVAAHLRAAPARGGPERWVRVNADRLADDVAAVTGVALSGILLPKATPESLRRTDSLLLDAERAAGVRPGSVAVLPVVETAAGLLEVAALSRGPRVQRLAIGEADLAADLGLVPGPDRAELAPHRAAIVVASAAAGLVAPVAPVETDLTATDDDLAASTAALLRQGFRARTAVHPKQIPVINAAFTPTADELDRARAVVDTLDAAGSGIAIDPRTGRMLDEAVVRSARDVLARAGSG